MPLFAYTPSIPDAPTTFFGPKKKAKKANFEAFTLVQASLVPNDLGLFWPILSHFRAFWGYFSGDPLKTRFLGEMQLMHRVYAKPTF